MRLGRVKVDGTTVIMPSGLRLYLRQSPLSRSAPNGGQLRLRSGAVHEAHIWRETVWRTSIKRLTANT